VSDIVTIKIAHFSHTACFSVFNYFCNTYRLSS